MMYVMDYTFKFDSLTLAALTVCLEEYHWHWNKFHASLQADRIEITIRFIETDRYILIKISVKRLRARDVKNQN